MYSVIKKNMKTQRDEKLVVNVTFRCAKDFLDELRIELILDKQIVKEYNNSFYTKTHYYYIDGINERGWPV